MTERLAAYDRQHDELPPCLPAMDAMPSIVRARGNLTQMNIVDSVRNIGAKFVVVWMEKKI